MSLLTTDSEAEAKDLPISAPAFNVTKVQSGIGVLIAGVLASVPAALQEDETVIITAVAAATVLMLGSFALVAVDMVTRQRSAKAKLQYGGKSSSSVSELKPAEGIRIMREGEPRKYNEVKLLTSDDAPPILLATSNSRALAVEFEATD